MSLFLICTLNGTFSAQTSQLEESQTRSSEEELQHILKNEIRKLNQENEENRKLYNQDKYEGNAFWKELDSRTHRRFLQENPAKLPTAKSQEERKRENDRINTEVRSLVNRQREYSKSLREQNIPTVPSAENDNPISIDQVLAQAAISGEIKEILKGEGITAFLKRKRCERVLQNKECLQEKENKAETNQTWRYTQSYVDLRLGMEKKTSYSNKLSLEENIYRYLMDFDPGYLDKYHQPIHIPEYTFPMKQQIDSFDIPESAWDKKYRIEQLKNYLNKIHDIIKFLSSEDDKSGEEIISRLSSNIDELTQMGDENQLNELKDKMRIDLKEIEKKVLEIIKQKKREEAKLAAKIIDEEEKHPHSFVFYHGMTEEGADFYDIINAFRHKLMISGDKGIAALRAFDDAFENIPSVKEFYEESLEKRGNTTDLDHSSWFRLRGISTCPFLFCSRNDTGESTWTFFMIAYSVFPLDLEKRLTDFFTDLGFEDAPIRANKYIEYLKSFKIRGRKPNGRLLQIFVNPEIVDKIAYLARPYGGQFALEFDGERTSEPSTALALLRNKPYHFKKLVGNQHKEGAFNEGYDLNKIQTRLYLAPEFMLDKSQVEIVDYMRHPDQYPSDHKQKIAQMANEDIKDWLNLPTAEKAIENKFHGNRIPNLLQLKKMMKIPKTEEK